MSTSTQETARLPLSEVVHSYNRVARIYASIVEPLFLIRPRARRKAVAALRLKPGDVVLELGAGTGRNLPYLIDAVGPGRVIGVDASPGMLAEARRLVERHGWSNVELLEQDAAQLDIDADVDAVLFSLSYSVMPNPAAVLALAWKRLRPGSRVVVMDMGLPKSRFPRLFAPIAKLLIKLGPGDPNSRPWDELARYGEVESESFMLGIYYVCTVEKPEA